MLRASSTIRVTIWMNMPSFYQADFFRTLRACEEVELQVVFARKLPDYRLQLGWEDDLNGYDYCFLEGHRPELRAARVAWAQRDRIHIIGGMFAEPCFVAALATLALGGGRYLIYSEAPDPFVPRNISKRLLKSLYGNVIARRAAGILAISRFAWNFFGTLGVAKERIYPFGYFCQNNQRSDSLKHSANDSRVEIIFIGQLVRRKGVDLLIQALEPIFKQYPNLFLTIVGAGEVEASLRAEVEALNLSERVIFEGVMPADKIPARLAAADLLVLPSRWDGWGLVVNEAFAAGVPVIVSDCCGAADLIDHGVNGYVFPSEDVNELRDCVYHFLNRETDRLSLARHASEMGNRVSTELAAPYFISCLKHVMGLSPEKPMPPWSVAKVTAQ